MPDKSILVFRFSAMGDVAMTQPVIKQLSANYPDLKIIVVSRPTFQPFFEDLPNVQFHPLFPKDKHKGIAGLYRLYNELQRYKPIALADLHDNIRSRVLSSFFRLHGVNIKRIDKGRKEKKKLTRPHNKILLPLKPTVDRYAEVFHQLGFHFTLKKELKKASLPVPSVFQHFFSQHSPKKIGIAPFAQHVYKMYPLTLMEQVISTLDQKYQLFIFGGGTQEEIVAHEWEKKYKRVVNVIGKAKLGEELDLIANLDLLLSMDSSGMHMASLVGTRVVSIWGPTHPYAGFLGFGQQESDCLQIEHPNRPSSVYGNKPCLCDGKPCIELISPIMVINKIENILDNG